MFKEGQNIGVTLHVKHDTGSACCSVCFARVLRCTCFLRPRDGFNDRPRPCEHCRGSRLPMRGLCNECKAVSQATIPVSISSILG